MAAVILYACISQLLTGCSKDNDEEQVLADGSLISVSVLGVTDDENISSLNSKTTSSTKFAVNPEASSVKLLRFKGFDASVSVEQEGVKKRKVSIKNAGKALSVSELMTAAVSPGIKYRLLLYKADGTFVSSTSLTSGTPGQVLARKGESYNWYAVSYNSTDSVPAVNSVNPTLTLPANQDVLYANGVITVPASELDGTTPLGITFKHSLARVAIELNTMGMFADMNSAAITVSGAVVRTGTLNLKTGELNNLSAPSSVTINYSNFSDVEFPYKDRKVAYYYTADAGTANNLTVSITGLNLKLDNGTDRSFAALLATTPSVFNFMLTPTLGRGYRATVNLIESPITLEGVRWARTNLYRQEGHNPYRFLHTYRSTNQRNSYFSFRGIVPETYGVDGDPCAFVYPEGVWRQASSAEFNTLTSVTLLGLDGGGNPITYGSDNGNYFLYAGATGTSAPYPGNQLRFYMNGNGNNLSLLDGVVQIDLGNTFANSVHVWTSTSGVNLLGLVGVGAVAYQGSTSIAPIVGRTNTRSQQINLLNVSAIGLDVLETDFKNIRCVRAEILDVFDR